MWWKYEMIWLYSHDCNIDYYCWLWEDDVEMSRHFSSKRRRSDLSNAMMRYEVTLAYFRFKMTYYNCTVPVRHIIAIPTAPLILYKLLKRLKYCENYRYYYYCQSQWRFSFFFKYYHGWRRTVFPHATTATIIIISSGILIGFSTYTLCTGSIIMFGFTWLHEWMYAYTYLELIVYWFILRHWDVSHMICTSLSLCVCMQVIMSVRVYLYNTFLSRFLKPEDDQLGAIVADFLGKGEEL